MSGAVEGTLSEADVRAAYRLRYGGWPINRILIFLGFCISIGAFISWLDDASERTMLMIMGIMTLYGCVAIVFIKLLNHFVILPFYARKIYRQQKDLQRAVQIVWDDEAIIIGNDAGTYRTPFAEFHKWRADEDMLLLYRSDNLFNMVPRSFLKGDAQLEALVTLLSDADVPGQRF